MTRLELKRYWMFYEAFKNDKVVQCKSTSVDEWIDLPYIDCLLQFPVESLRIKPETAKRLPTIEEVEKWFLENRVFILKSSNCMLRITSFTTTPCDLTEEYICIDVNWYTIQEFCKHFTHYDGSSLYITE